MKTSLVIALAILALLTCSVAWADDAALGERLVRELFSDLKARKVEKVTDFISPAFQSVHGFGAKGKAGEVALLHKLNLGDYELTGFQVTRQGPALVVTYRVQIEETLQGKRVKAKDAGRLTVFLETESGWKWLAHANMNGCK